MNSKLKTFLPLLIAFALGVILTISFNGNGVLGESTVPRTESSASEKSYSKAPIENLDADISDLTKENVVVAYVKKNHHLPDYYITKSKARKKGWVPSKGNLCEVLPGKAIGGDRFSNREGRLPKGVQYYEADLNYLCGHRQTDRMVFTNEGEVWVTYDHYKTFQKK